MPFCIAGIPVRNCQTDASIFFMIMELMRKWLLPPDVTRTQQGLLTPKELLVLLQRLAQVDRVQGIPTSLRKTWESGFLDLLYDVITTRKVCWSFWLKSKVKNQCHYSSNLFDSSFNFRRNALCCRTTISVRRYFDE